jgi:hypothetical protein
VLFLSAALFAQQQTASPRRTNELTLAGLRPGHDSLTAAQKHYRAKYSSKDTDSASEKLWGDPCTGHSLTLKLDAHGVIQTITVSSLVQLEGKCLGLRTDAVDEKDWVTGKGLHLGDPQDRVSDLYGDASSSGPAVNGTNELEFLSYPFGWAGSDVPQEMDIYCARDTGRVVEITLAFPKPAEIAPRAPGDE